MRILKISLLGMPYSGKKTAYFKLVELGILESLPSNPPLRFLDSQFYFQPARLSDFLMHKTEKWKPFYDHVFLFSWYSGPSFSATLLEELLLRDCQGILFFAHAAPGFLSANQKAWKRFTQHFPRFHSCPLDQFPLVICYNQIDEVGKKLPSTEDVDSEMCLPTEHGTLRPANRLEGKFLRGLNEKLNPHGFPYVFTSAKTGYQIDKAFFLLLERIRHFLQLSPPAD